MAKRILLILFIHIPFSVGAEVQHIEPVHIGDGSTVGSSKAWLHVNNPNDLVSYETMTIKASRNSNGANERPALVLENPTGHLRAMFNSEGQYLTNGWLTISGNFQAERRANGDIGIGSTGHPHPGTNYMLAVYSDIDAPAVIVRDAGHANGSLFMGVDVSNNVTFGIDPYGQLRWGPGPERTDLDLELERYVTAAGDTALRMTTRLGEVIKLEPQSAIARPTGGAVIDAEARAAVEDIIDALEATGFLQQNFASVPAVPSWVMLLASWIILWRARRIVHASTPPA